jgi:hypothetical protein
VAAYGKLPLTFEPNQDETDPQAKFLVRGRGYTSKTAWSSLLSQDAAYSLIAQRVTANQTSFYVYQDADSGFNHGFPSGFFGATNKIDLDAACVNDPNTANGCSTDPNRLDRERGTVLRISFDRLSPGEFAGVNIEEPERWGVLRTGMGYDLRGATDVVFEVCSPTGLRLQLGAGERATNFFDIPPGCSSYTTMRISINSLTPFPPDLADLHVLFTVATNSLNAPHGGTVLLDNIRFEPVPTNRQSALSFPLSTQAFGVVPLQNPAPGRVPFPPDQVLRNLTTAYESALTLLALLARGTPEDLRNASLIADTFHYALHHDNDGDPLPVAPDGSVGLHNGYMSGDIALFNDQAAPAAGRKGVVRLPGFSASTGLCGPAGFCLVLDGATGGNNAFAILALVAAFKQFNDIRYLEDASTIGNWITANLTDTTNTGFGGYYLGYPDEGVVPKIVIKGKSIENNADIFAAFTALAAIESQLGNDPQAAQWTAQANVAGDFVMEMFDPVGGRFHAGTVPVGTPPGPGISPGGPRRGDDTMNTFDFLDSNTFTTLAMVAAPRYRNQIDWRRPVQFVLDNFAQSITVGSQEFQGFNIVKNPTDGPNGIAWEFTGQAVAAMLFVDCIHQESRFKGPADFYLNQLRQAQILAPFGDSQGLVASTLQDGDGLPPLEQCLSTPFQCIPERVGLAATTWGILADQNVNPLSTAADFMVSVSPASVAVTAGQSATYTVTVSPQGCSFDNAVSLSCSGLPALTSCTFSPSSVTPGANPVTSTLTVSTRAPMAFLAPPVGPGEVPLYAVWLGLPGLALLGVCIVGQESKNRKIAFLILLLAVLALLAACGGGDGTRPSPPPPRPGTPTGTHTITITGTSGSLERTTTATLVVQ